MKSNADGGQFIVFSDSQLESIYNLDILTTISIDPGVKNLAICVTTRYVDINNREYASKVSTRLLELTNYDYAVKNNSNPVYRDISKYVDSKEDIFMEASLVIIEYQMADLPLRISQHLITYFMTRYPNMIVIQISTHMKARYLGANKKIELKKRAVEESSRLHLIRGDTNGIKLLAEGKSRKHDKADAIIQEEAFFANIGFMESRSEKEAMFEKNLPKMLKL